MPKRAIILQEIADKNKRKTTSKARLHGLMKKIGEWIILCNTEFLGFAITDDGVVTAITSEEQPLEHLKRIYDIYVHQSKPNWIGEGTEEPKYFIQNYNKRNVMRTFGKRRVVYIDPRKKQLQRIRRISKPTTVTEETKPSYNGMLSTDELEQFNATFAECINISKL
jgi:sugar lactone lactonase YvrE